MTTAEMKLTPGETGDCQRCLVDLREQLATLPGVEQVKLAGEPVELAIRFDPTRLAPQDLHAAADEFSTALRRRYAHEIIRVSGLDCADCAATVESAVARLPGVVTSRINFAAGTILVEYEREKADRRQILAEIHNLGYETGEQKVGGQASSTFLLSGLDCADCAVSVERNLASLPGVISAKVNFATATLEVRHSPTVRADEIASVVEASGYGAAPVRQGQADKQASFWVRNRRAALTVAAGASLLLGLAVSWLRLPNPDWSEPVSHGLLLLATALGGFHVARAGLYGLVRSRSLDMNVLMTAAVLGALALGQWEEAATVVVLFALGNSLEGYTMDRARGAIRSLLALAPNTARVRRDGREQTVPAEQVAVGETVLVRPGEKVPVDGLVTAGVSGVNEAPVTGESLPVEKVAGDEVYAGSLNERGYLEVRATRPYGQNTISRIVHLVEEAQGQRARSQRFVDEFSRYYTPAVMAGALAVATVPYFLLGQPFDPWFYRALVLLIIACPCALVISTPVAIVSAIARAARLGVLIKGGAYLEAAGRLNVVAFDKTGTLTVGRPEVTDVIALNGLDEDDLLRLAGRLEERSEHPLAAAILRRADGHRHADSLPPVADFVSLPGRGLRARLADQTYYLGNQRLLAEVGVPLNGSAARIESLLGEGKTVLLLADEVSLLGYVAVADRLRPGAKEAVAELRQSGVRRVVLLTGDQEATARAIAQAAGVDEYKAGLLPDEKVAAIQDLRRRYGAVGMVGDGVNDAPALAVANVGIAMGAAGSDVALETADVALMADDLSKVGFAVGLARGALDTIRQNVAFALAIKAVFLALAVLGVATLWLAILADTGASLVVTLNGMRLLGYGRRFARPSAEHREAHAAVECTAEHCHCGHEHGHDGDEREEEESGLEASSLAEGSPEHDHAGHTHS
ncbi:MAG: cadmium-translocating P-type ATPase [Chloroflexi bacterium]|nr:cadmium-translocating P-type ATPase [Chloroflexota bacterium]